jgi:serine/threonine protein kinase
MDVDEEKNGSYSNRGSHGGIYVVKNDTNTVCKIAFDRSEAGGLIETSLREVSALMLLQESSCIPKIEKIEISENATKNDENGLPSSRNGKISIFMKRYPHNLHTYFEANKKCLPEDEIRSILYSIVCAYSDASKLSIIHRDIKPQNILVGARTGPQTPPLLQNDLGDFDDIDMECEDDCDEKEDDGDEEEKNGEEEEKNGEEEEKNKEEKNKEEKEKKEEENKEEKDEKENSNILPIIDTATLNSCEWKNSEKVIPTFPPPCFESLLLLPSSLCSSSPLLSSSSSSTLCQKRGCEARETGRSGPQSGPQVVLADWGICRFMDFAGPASFTNPVQTLWYRDPRLLLQEKTPYAEEIDIWSIATIAYELYTGKPAFCEAEDERELLFTIFEMFGAPDNSSWPGVEKMEYYEEKFLKLKLDPQQRREKFEKLFNFRKNASFDAIDLVYKLFEICPEKRLKIDEILQHPYFSTLAPNETKETKEKDKLKYEWKKDWMTVQKDITPIMRRILIDWLMEVKKSFNVLDRVFFLAIYYIDIVLSSIVLEKRELQLLGITCLLVAEKIMLKYSKDIEQLVEITDNAYSAKEMMKMEITIVNALGFSLFKNTEYSTLYRIWKRDYGSNDENDLKTSKSILKDSVNILHQCLLNTDVREIDQDSLIVQILDFAKKNILSTELGNLVKKFSTTQTTLLLKTQSRELFKILSK